MLFVRCCEGVLCRVNNSETTNRLEEIDKTSPTPRVHQGDTSTSGSTGYPGRLYDITPGTWHKIRLYIGYRKVVKTQNTGKTCKTRYWRRLNSRTPGKREEQDTYNKTPGKHLQDIRKAFTFTHDIHNTEKAYTIQITDTFVKHVTEQT